ncbi:MAG: hypothetical protein HY695_24735 [Deltaproteobacteria bacterium]|nr:hypothetical protein [Deltaproteobacteria bacterium]
MLVSRCLLVVCLTSVIAGCVLTDATLEIGYTAAQASRGPLAAIPPARVEIGAIEDRRPERDKIGYKRHGLSDQWKTAKMTTKKAVPEIVREALAIELTKNGHSVGGLGDDLILSGEVTDFWCDIRPGVYAWEFVASTELDLTLADRKAGSTLYRRTYRGYHRDTVVHAALASAWERVMNKALEEMMREIGTDVSLAQAASRSRSK